MTKDQGQKTKHIDNGVHIDDEPSILCNMNTNTTNERLQEKLNENNNKKDMTSANNNNNHRMKTVCYDFIKGNCRRRSCRFPHVMSPDQVIFCHDYQNGGCFRNSCRFIHQTVEDEEYYRQYGSFPAHPEQIAPSMNGATNVGSNHQPSSFAPNPQFNLRDDNIQVHQNTPPPMYGIQPAPLQNGRRRSYGMISDIIPQKRPHLEQATPTIESFAYNQQAPPRTGYEQQHQPQPQQQQPGAAVAPHISAPNVSVVIGEDVINLYRLYEEHNLLRRRVEINEERLHELRATNTYLLHQNEQLRRQSQCSCTSTIVNPVTLTTTSQQQPATQVLNAVSIAPVQMQSTPIVSIASIAGAQPTQIIASTPSLAITATQGQQLALASTQPPTQILGTSQITLTPAQSMGIINTSQPLAMSANATQPIISYPVMTHSILPH